jgi:uncharacterized protein YbaP (TraB family)
MRRFVFPCQGTVCGLGAFLFCGAFGFAQEVGPISRTPDVAGSVSSGHRPWIWRVESEFTQIWLVGVLHVAGRDEERHYSRYAGLLGSVSRVYFETLPGAWETLGARKVLEHRGALAKSSSLKGQVSEETFQFVERLAAEHPGVFPEISRFRPWLACLEVEKAGYNRLGLTAEAGLEDYLAAHAVRLSRPIGSLETPAEQIEALASLSRREQEAALNNTLREFAAGSPAMKQVRSDWMSGDLEMMRRVLGLIPGRERTPLQRALLDERNRKWAKRVEAMLGEREPVMIAVGVNHLIAPGIGLPELLRDKGFEVVRVD